MELQEISKIQDAVELLNESTLDLKEALIYKSGNTEMLKMKYNHAATGAIMVLSESIINRKIEEDEAIKDRYKQRLLEIICYVYSVDKKVLLASGKITRKKEFKDARQIHMAFLHKTFGMSQTAAAGIYGQDHCTCIHSFKKIRDYFQTDRMFREINAPIIDHCVLYDKLIRQNRTMNYLTEKTK